MNDRQQLIDAIKLLLKYSMLFTSEAKQEIIKNVESYSDKSIVALGKILAVEHEHRDEVCTFLTKQGTT